MCRRSGFCYEETVRRDVCVDGWTSYMRARFMCYEQTWWFGRQTQSELRSGFSDCDPDSATQPHTHTHVHIHLNRPGRPRRRGPLGRRTPGRGVGEGQYQVDTTRYCRSWFWLMISRQDLSRALVRGRGIVFRYYYQSMACLLYTSDAADE